jgi:glycosyltransferase involved in cell wall biosynthesis
MLPPLRYIVPVHNDEASIEASVDKLVKELSRRPPSMGRHEVLLVENGSRDRSFAVIEKLEGLRDGVFVRAYMEPNAGLGYAYDRGLREAGKLGGDGYWDVLTASDLPFDFSDLDEFEDWLESAPRERMAVGSKAHPASVIPKRPGARGLMTHAYRFARRAILGMRTGDSQGSFFVREDLAAELVPELRSRDFFYTTELVHFSERRGELPKELPIRVGPLNPGSTVRPLKHGTAMFLALLALRRRSR